MTKDEWNEKLRQWAREDAHLEKLPFMFMEALAEHLARHDLPQNRFERVVAEIAHERERQNKKWGDQDHPDLLWLAIFLEEVGEVGKALVEAKAKNSGDAYPMRVELVHAVAVGVQWLEKL